MTLQNNFCSNCGEKLPADGRFCAHCGEKINRVEKTKTDEVKDKIFKNSNSVVNRKSVNNSDKKVNHLQPKSWDEYFEIKNKFLKQGFLFVIIPFVCLLIFAVIAELLNDGSGIAVLFGILAVISAIAQVIGFIFAIYYWCRQVPYPDADYDKRSGLGNKSEIPNEIGFFNPGAAGLGLIWGFVYKVYIIPICIIALNIIIYLISVSILNESRSDNGEGGWMLLALFMILYISFLITYGSGNANMTAWRKQRWPNVEKFMEIQKKWRVWGIVFLCLILLSLSLNFGIILFKIKIIENLNKNVNVLNPLSSKKNNFLNELETHLGVLKEDLVALKMKSDVKEREFEVEIPETWEMINYDNNDASNDMQKKVIHLQPKDDVNFIDAVVIKKDDDYNDFIALTLREKKSLFSNLAIIDEYDFLGGYMIYFTNVIDSVEVPTVLILTKDNIYRAAFNINNKMLSNYFTYRNDFENFIYTFRQL